MCLDKIDEKIKKNVKFGWKVFVKGTDGSGKIEYYGPCRAMAYDMTDWNIDECPWDIQSTFGGIYTAGYHVFKTHAAARRWKQNSEIVKKVEVDDIVSSGLQDGHSVIVCRKFRLVK